MHKTIDSLSAQIEEMGAEMQRLHNALAFWLPSVPTNNGPMRDRIVNDAYLLVGYDDIPDDKTAEELGWIRKSA